MRRVGAFLMILGANLVVGAIAAAFWLASLGCAMGAADGQCRQDALELLIDAMGSGSGTIFWVAIIAGLLLFWRGKRMRARAGTDD